jgi:hypothetical protein
MTEATVAPSLELPELLRSIDQNSALFRRLREYQKERPIVAWDLFSMDNFPRQVLMLSFSKFDHAVLVFSEGRLVHWQPHHENADLTHARIYRRFTEPPPAVDVNT